MIGYKVETRFSIIDKSSTLCHKLFMFTKLHIIIGVLVIVGIVLIKGEVFTSAAPKGTPTSSVKVTVASPNGGEQFRQGTANTINWKGGYGSVAVGLATPDADTNHAIALPGDSTPDTGPNSIGTTGKVIGFINTREGEGYYLPNSLTTWDGLRVCNYHLNLDPDTWCVDVAPGNYKIFVWSNGENNQSKCIGSGEGPTGKYTTKNNYGCNWDVSDQPFTILAP